MDSEALQTFVAIHRAGGFSLAAEKLSRSQPAISRRMALLEDEIGAPLFERMAGGVALSEAGRVLLPHAERVLAALKDTTDALSALRSGDGGVISLAVVGTLAGSGLTAALRRFAKQCPQIEISLRTAVSTEVSELVRSGEATIGLRYYEERSPDLVGVTLKPERLVIACAPTHRLADKRLRSLRDLKNEKWLAFPDQEARRDPSTGNMFAQFLTRDVAQIQWMPVDSLTAQKRLVEADFGIALLPESSIAEERKTKALAVIAVGDLDAANPVTLITRRDGYLSAASKALLEILTSEF
ncbi:MAG: LysR family transcriptional regulator [Parvibaculum sp.]|nr:LysR family transcriptional regulator [Parvibaculum sp.]